MAASIVVVLGFLLFLPEGGPAAAKKFRLGLPEWNFRTNSVPVLLLYGLFWYLQRYVAD